MICDSEPTARALSLPGLESYPLPAPVQNGGDRLETELCEQLKRVKSPFQW